ncbi:hypothetical protein PO654_05505 [Phytobacter diazotrophicus]|nr:hypothetical protein [Enterobacteriaceae bacterium]QJF16902.1 hypothetical protein HHA33_10305 [Phytobacter diazotrophicus]
MSQQTRLTVTRSRQNAYRDDLPLTQGIKHLFGAHQIRTLPGLAIKL